LAKGDERIVAMERVQQKLGLPVGEHLQLAGQIEQALLNNFDEGMNINGYIPPFFPIWVIPLKRYTGFLLYW